MTKDYIFYYHILPIVASLVFFIIIGVQPCRCWKCSGKGTSIYPWHEHSTINLKGNVCGGYGYIIKNAYQKHFIKKYKHCQKCDGSGTVLKSFHGDYGSYRNDSTCPECEGRGMK